MGRTTGAGLARLPDYIELGGDQSATYVYVANSHDGSMAVTAAVTPVRIACANTLGTALRQPEHGQQAQRTFRFRHTGNLQSKFAEARQVLGMTIHYQRQFKVLADRLAMDSISERALEHGVLRRLWPVDKDLGKLARLNRRRTIDSVLAIFRGEGVGGDTTGNSPGSKWVAFNAIAEHLDYGRRYTARTNQVQRSFEDTSIKQRALERIVSA